MAKSRHKKINKQRQPRTAADVERAKGSAVNEAVKLAWTILFTVLVDKEGYTVEQLQRVWNEVDYLSDSIKKGYVNCADLRHVLRTEYGINITD